MAEVKPAPIATPIPTRQLHSTDWLSNTEIRALTLASRLGEAYPAMLKKLYGSEMISDAKLVDLLALSASLGGEALSGETIHILNKLRDKYATELQRAKRLDEEKRAADRSMGNSMFGSILLSPLRDAPGRAPLMTPDDEVTPQIITFIISKILEMVGNETAAERLADGTDPQTGVKNARPPDFREAAQRLFSAHRVATESLGLTSNPRGSSDSERIMWSSEADDLLWRATGYLKLDAERADFIGDFRRAGDSWRNAAQYVVLLKINGQPEAATMLLQRAIKSYTFAHDWESALKCVDRIEQLDAGVSQVPRNERQYLNNLKELLDNIQAAVRNFQADPAWDEKRLAEEMRKNAQAIGLIGQVLKKIGDELGARSAAR